MINDKGMTDLGQEYPSICCESASPDSAKSKKKRVDYPTLYIRGKSLPDFGDGEFYFIAKGKKIGYRNPVDSDSEKSCEIAVMAIKPAESGESSEGLEGALKAMARAKKSK